MQVQSLGQEDILEKGMATHMRILAWKIHEQRNLVSYSPCSCKESDSTEQLTLLLSVIQLFLFEGDLVKSVHVCLVMFTSAKPSDS